MVNVHSYVNVYQRIILEDGIVMVLSWLPFSDPSQDQESPRPCILKSSKWTLTIPNVVYLPL